MTDHPVGSRGGAALRRDSAMLLGAHVFYRVAGVLLTLVLSRTLSAHAIGLYSLAISLCGGLAAVTTLGLGPLLSRRVATDPEHARDHLGAVLGLRAALLPLYGIAVAALAWSFGPEARVPILIIGAGSLLESLYFSFGGFFLGCGRAVWNVAIGIGVQVVFTTLAVAALLLTGRLEGLLLAELARGALLLGLAAAVVLVRFGPLRLRWDRTLMKDGLPFAGIAALNAARERADAVTLGLTAGYTLLGSYHLAYQAVNALVFIPSAVTGVFSPWLAARGASAEARGRLARWAAGVALLGAGAAACLWTAADPLSRLLFAGHAAATAPLLRLLGLLLPLSFADLFLQSCLQALGQERKLAFVAGITAAASVAANVLLVPPFGVYGAVAARGVSVLLRLAVSAGLMLGYLRRETALPEGAAA